MKGFLGVFFGGHWDPKEYKTGGVARLGIISQFGILDRSLTGVQIRCQIIENIINVLASKKQFYLNQ